MRWRFRALVRCLKADGRWLARIERGRRCLSASSSKCAIDGRCWFRDLRESFRLVSKLLGCLKWI
uniref:Uncharacterized protein n=1 Tax=Strigamia maritima TaxID=126957 RepID=T1IP59_STRMM